MSTKKAVAKKEDHLPPADLAKMMAADAGKGTSTKQEDNIIPLISILQALSPQVNKRNSEHIERAEPGVIWLRNAPTQIVDGEEGIKVQACHFSKSWVEWVPRDNGGGFVARHEECPADAREERDPQNQNRVRYVRPNGNEVVETRYYAVVVYLDDGTKMQYVIPFTSSGHVVARDWMTKINSVRHPAGYKPSMWSKFYRLTTKERTNAAGTWFIFHVADAGWVTDAEDYMRGKVLHEAFESGEKQADTAEDQHVEEEEDAM